MPEQAQSRQRTPALRVCIHQDSGDAQLGQHGAQHACSNHEREELMAVEAAEACRGGTRGADSCAQPLAVRHQAWAEHERMQTPARTQERSLAHTCTEEGTACSAQLSTVLSRPAAAAAPCATSSDARGCHQRLAFHSPPLCINTPRISSSSTAAVPAACGAALLRREAEFMALCSTAGQSGAVLMK